MPRPRASSPDRYDISAPHPELRVRGNAVYDETGRITLVAHIKYIPPSRHSLKKWVGITPDGRRTVECDSKEMVAVALYLGHWENSLW